MRDNVDLKIEKLYSAYQKTLNAEDTANSAKDVVYSFSELKLPDKSMYAKGFNYNNKLIRDDYVNSMSKLQSVYGGKGVGLIEQTRKHIHKLMDLISERDAVAKTFFEQMESKQMSTIEAFGSDVDTAISKVSDFIDNTGDKAIGHMGVAKVGNVVSASYDGGIKAVDHYANTEIAKVAYDHAVLKGTAKSHASMSDEFSRSSRGEYIPQGFTKVEAVGHVIDNFKNKKANENNVIDSMLTFSK